jgi:hypothetical protein
MSKNSKHDWPALMQAFETSGLTQTKFCEQNNLNPKYFSLKRSKLSPSKKSVPAFQKVAVEKRIDLSIPLVIHVGRCKIECPASMSSKQLATLVHELA